MTRNFAVSAALVSAPAAVDPPERDPVDVICAALGPERAMLVLDNCEHLVRATAEWAERLLTSCSAVDILATSREALLVRGEQVLALGPLSLTAPEGATQLFVDRVRAERGTFDPDADELDAIVELCGHLDGMPLAIELAAARARSLGGGPEFAAGSLGALSAKRDTLLACANRASTNWNAAEKVDYTRGV